MEGIGRAESGTEAESNAGAIAEDSGIRQNDGIRNKLRGHNPQRLNTLPPCRATS